jgi:hypothetical protein
MPHQFNPNSKVFIFLFCININDAKLNCDVSSTKKMTAVGITQTPVRTRRQIKDGHSQNVQLLEMGHRNDVITFSTLDTLLIL